MKTLEKILQEYFGCEQPFDAATYENPTGFTEAGNNAYKCLISLLDDIGDLADCNEEINTVVALLDDITYEDEYDLE